MMDTAFHALLSPSIGYFSGMKNIIVAFSALGIASLHADGPPRGSFKSSEFELARAAAADSGKPIAVILTSFDGSCPHTDAGNEQVNKEMKRDYVLVYDSPRSLTSTGGPLVSAMNASMKTHGNTTPCVAVVDGKSLEYLGGVSYRGIKADTRKWEKNLRAEMDIARTKLDTTSEEKPDEKSLPADEAPATEMREWKNAKGQTIRASVISKDLLKVTFKMENGKIVDYPLNLLSEESRNIIEGED